MKKYLSLLLLAVIVAAVFSAATVVTVPKVAAQPTQEPYVFAVDYARAPVGTTYRWTVMNYHSVTPAAQVEKQGYWADGCATGSVAFASARISPDGPRSGQEAADVGVLLHVDPGTGDWQTLKNRQVEVKVTLSTTLQMSGSAIGGPSAGLQTTGTGGRFSETYASIRENNVYENRETITLKPSSSNTVQTMDEKVIAGVGVSFFFPHDTAHETAHVRVDSIDVTLTT